MKCSKLNAHLYSLHVVDSPGCSCGHDTEDSNHYLLICPLYQTSRNKMLKSIAAITPQTLIDSNLLLYGSDGLTKAVNTDIFQLVHLFIEETARL